MMNQDNPYAMNQTCKVCGEPAAGFHFGAFTCEGCKSFFGRSYNNLSSISDCKNNGECIINKKNRTACKACRLRKCLLVGMSKSGSRYGRRSNWFKIHCLLQEQQQQAAAAMAAAAQHHNSQHQQHHHHHQQQHQQQQSGQHQSQLNSHHSPVGKSSLGAAGLPNSAAAAAALGMLGHAGAYPGLYPPRTKEELMMLGLEEYAKHPASASPCVSSPDSHNSDSSVEINVRNNTLLHLAKHPADAVTPPQLRKDALHPFLPLPFPGLSSMPVMPPPSFLPPSHLLFPGYHPALYQHHQGLLKPSPEQQQAAAAAAAVQQLFNSSNSSPSRFTPTVDIPPQCSPKLNNDIDVTSNAAAKTEHVTGLNSSNSSDELHAINNNNNNSSNHQQYLANGNKAAEELTKRFYLDAVLKSQRAPSPPPSTTKLPARSTHDHSISALVTPNSDSGRERLASLQSPALENEEHEDGDTVDQRHATEKLDNDCAEEEDVVVSMTPPSSPVASNVANAAGDSTTPSSGRQQDNPIDLSLKTGSSISACSSISSKSSIASSPLPEQQRRSSKDSELDGEFEEETEEERKSVDLENGVQRTKASSVSGSDSAEDEDNSTVETVKTTVLRNNNNNNNSNSFCNQTNNNNTPPEPIALNTKRKLEELTKFNLDFAASQRLDLKRLKVDCVAAAATATTNTTTATTPLDLTTKV